MEKVEFSDIATIIVALINLVGVIISARKVKKKSKENKVHLKWKTLLIVFLILCVFFTALVIWGPWRQPKITISNISEDDSVAIDVMVKGTSKNIPQNQKIWMVIFSHPVSRFYPQEEPVDMQVGGDWSSRCYFGIKKDVGQKFDLLAVLADRETQQLFQEYLDESRRIEEWRGLEKLPDNVKVFQRITVVRK